MPLLSLTAMIVSKKNVKAIDIEVPEYANKNEQIRITVSVKNAGWLPIISNEVKILCILYDKCIESVSESKVEVAIKPGETKQIVLKTAIPYYALTEIMVESIRIRDYFGLFHTTKRIISRKLNRQDNKYSDIKAQGMVKQIPVIPFIGENFDNDRNNAILRDLNVFFDLQTSTAVNAFSNSGEFVGVREYRAGDTRNRIHQKLSAKSDIVLVKEFNESKYPPILLVLDLFESLYSSFRETDMFIDEFVQTAVSLTSEQIPFFALLYGFDYEARPVNDTDDLKKLLIHFIETISLSKYNEHISDGIPQQFGIIYSFPENRADE
jgi:hypothetical protein